eukprot:GFUD01010065.1.p1 GENE.GFUD01010065.1~~GFUD01010065.1.p1  ORF type:complete len:117 (-),score=22.42 GFUD01010065.1:99-449(-)
MRRNTDDIVNSRSIQENKDLAVIENKEAKAEKEKVANFLQRPVSTDQNITGKLEGLQKEVERLREARSCKICMEKEASILFLPCGHLCSCANCAPALQACAVCRTTIKGLVKTFMV